MSLIDVQGHWQGSCDCHALGLVTVTFPVHAVEEYFLREVIGLKYSHHMYFLFILKLATRLAVLIHVSISFPTCPDQVITSPNIYRLSNCIMVDCNNCFDLCAVCAITKDRKIGQRASLYTN